MRRKLLALWGAQGLALGIALPPLGITGRWQMIAAVAVIAVVERIGLNVERKLGLWGPS